MSPSLTLEPVVAFAPHDPLSAQANVRANNQPNAAKSSTFVERRRLAQADAECTIRSPVVLGFAGLVGGLLLSAALIMLVALVLAIYEARWSNASQYCVITVLIVFGTAGTMLYWDVAHAKTRILAFIEPAIERRNYYLYLSSVDAFENVRTLNSRTHPAPALEGTRSMSPRPAPMQRSVRPDPVQAPLWNTPRAVADKWYPRGDRQGETAACNSLTQAALHARQAYGISRRRQLGLA